MTIIYYFIFIDNLLIIINFVLKYILILNFNSFIFTYNYLS
jgi:hypothetical protein